MAKESEGDADNGFELVQRDSVPIPQPQPNASLEKRLTSLRTWLQPTSYLSPGNEFMKHLHSYAAGTGQWSHASPVFQSWVDADRADAACLHARGVAGSGKSVFAATTIRGLQDAGHMVLFFFFRQIVDKNHAAKYLVRDFAAQLAPYCPSLVTALDAASQEHGVDGHEMDLVWPALKEALAARGSVPEPGVVPGPVYCVVDALDEMDDADFDGMVQKLVALGTITSGRVKVMMTSRPLPKIEKALASPGIMHLRLDPEILSPDVARYVNTRMATLERPLTEAKTKLVRDVICERASGLFLHARLAVDNLAEGLRDTRITEETLPDSLERIPSSLREVYEDMLREHARRSSVTAEQQAKILMCVTHASRPLRLIELGSLISRMLDLDLRRGKELVRAACGRLLEIMEDESVSVIHHSFTEFLHDEERKDNPEAFPVLEDVVSHAMLAILSLEYLDSCPPDEATADNDNERDKEEANHEDYTDSERQEKKNNELRTRMRSHHPLISYATDNLAFHLARAANGNTGQVLEAMDKLFVPQKPAFRNWILFMWKERPSDDVNVLHLGTGTYKDHAMPLWIMQHFASQNPHLIDKADAADRTPLSYAAEWGFEEKVSFLLTVGADAARAGQHGLTPMHIAARNRHAGIVRKFLDIGIDPLIKTAPVMAWYNHIEGYWVTYSEKEAEQRRESALSQAFIGDNPKVITAFLPFIPASQVNSFFHRTKNLEIMEALLDTGKVDIDCYMQGTTKLYDAMTGPDVALVKLLLDRGADPMKRCRRRRDFSSSTTVVLELDKEDSERGPTPLHALTNPKTRDVQFSGDGEKVAECLRLIIAAGADINATMDPEYGTWNATPLHLAVQRTESMWENWGSLDKSEEILTESLLAAGADSTAQNADGDTPIHIANLEKPRLFEILMKHGGGNARNARGRTPLHEMIHGMARTQRSSSRAVKPKADAIKMLMDHDEDVRAIDDEGNNVFHHIMHSMGQVSNMHDTSLIADLLERADPDDLNRKNKKNLSPLWHYKMFDSIWGCPDDNDEDILRSMSNAGLDLDSRNNQGQTILWHLISFYEGLSTIKKFVRLGVDPKTQDDSGETLLHAVVDRRRPLEWINYLFSIGVEAITNPITGNNLIHVALWDDEDAAYAASTLDLLVRAGVDPLAMNHKGQTALHNPASVHHLDLVLRNPYFKDLDINHQDHEGLSPLHHAIPLDKEIAIHSLVQRGGDPILVAHDGTSPLHAAAWGGYPGILGLLLAKYRERGVLQSLVNSMGAGRTPLHFACQSGEVESVLLLLQHGANPVIMDDSGLEPLHAVAEIEHPSSLRTYHTRAADIVGLLKRAGADLEATARVKRATSDDHSKGPTNADQTNIMTPLDLAVANESWDMARVLLSYGVEPSAKLLQLPQFLLATDKTKAAEEAERVQRAQASRLKDQDIPKDNRYRDKSIEWRGRWASSMQKQKAHEDKEDNSKVVFVSGGQSILDAIKDKQYDEEVHGEAATEALESLLRQGDYESISEYAALGGGLVMPRIYRYRGTFFHHLIEEGHTTLLEQFGDKVAELLQSGDDLKSDDCDGYNDSTGTLLAKACEKRTPSLHIIKLLVEKFGADVNAISSESSAPIHILATGRYFWQIEALGYLVSQGADIELRDSRGQTALLIAVQNQASEGPWCEQIARLLLQHRADPNTKVKRVDYAGTVRNDGRYAIEMSRRAEITKLLLEYGAKLDGLPELLRDNIRNNMNSDNVRCLLSAGLDPNSIPATPEHTGFPQGEGGHDTDIIRYALHQAALPYSEESPDLDFDSRQQATIEVLLLHGADPLAQYPDGSFVLQRIIEARGRFDCLISYLTKMDVNLIGHRNRTMLASACIPASPVSDDDSGDQCFDKPRTVMADAILALLDNEELNTLIADDAGRTPLHWLCTFAGPLEDNFNKALKALIDREPRALGVKDSEGHTPLHLALRTFATQRSQTSTSIIRQLINSGADVAQTDSIKGDSALHYIAPRLGGEKHSAAEAAALFRELVVDSGLDVNARNRDGETPIFRLCAARWDGTRDPKDKEPHPRYAKAHDITHDKALDIFVELGADLLATDSRGRNLLHVTAARKLSDSSSDWHEKDDLTDVFKKLMSLGVDPRREDDELRTAIDIAVARDLWYVVNLFSKKKKEVED